MHAAGRGCHPPGAGSGPWGVAQRGGGHHGGAYRNVWLRIEFAAGDVRGTASPGTPLGTMPEGSRIGLALSFMGMGKYGGQSLRLARSHTGSLCDSCEIHFTARLCHPASHPGSIEAEVTEDRSAPGAEHRRGPVVEAHS